MTGTFLASEARVLGRLLDAHGIDGAALYRDAGLNLAVAKDPRGRFPFDRVVKAWGQAAKLVGNPHFALELSKFYRPTDFQGLVVVFLASPDLKTALERLVRYHVVINTALKPRVETGKARVELFYGTLAVDNDAKCAMEDGRASVLMDLCRTGASGNLDPLEVAFTYPRPADVSVHEAIFRCPLRFGAPEWKIAFRIDDTTRPFLAPNRELARSNDQVLDRMVKSLRQDDLVSRVKMAMVDGLPSGTPSEDTIARSVSMSTRSLQRRLSSLGANFSTLLAAVRRELAEEYVRDPEVPVTEISYMLGFSDVSSFSRAFKRWTGRSPAALRRRDPAIGAR